MDDFRPLTLRDGRQVRARIGDDIEVVIEAGGVVCSASIPCPGSGVAGGLGSASYAAADGASATTQKTLTVIIKYDEQGRVRDFAYHTSTF